MRTCSTIGLHPHKHIHAHAGAGAAAEASGSAPGVKATLHLQADGTSVRLALSPAASIPEDDLLVRVQLQGAWAGGARNGGAPVHLRQGGAWCSTDAH